VARLLSDKGFMVITGAGGGIMEAGNKGAGENRSFGVNISLPFEQVSNPYIAGERLINFKYFFTRKLVFLKESDATILLPGGFGTLDEGLEVMTLLQTGKTKPRPIILLQPEGDTYWNSFVEFLKDGLAQNRYIGGNDLSLVKIAKTPEQAAEEVARFYSVFHSVRYIGNKTILRFSKKIPDKVLKSVNSKFNDIIVEGQIERCPPTKAEVDNAEFPDLPRLNMLFDKKRFDRLIDLIWYISKNV
ncbi:MAG: TIGR00730 family Rossman fold protein, partial [Nitrospinota bacterium]